MEKTKIRAALAGSILKWSKLASGETYEENGCADCPLCSLFRDTSIDECSYECPIVAVTGEQSCRGTPYRKAKDALTKVMEMMATTCGCNLCMKTKNEARSRSQEMLDFLKTLTIPEDRCEDTLAWVKNNKPTQEEIDRLSGKPGLYKVRELVEGLIPEGSTYLSLSPVLGYGSPIFISYNNAKLAPGTARWLLGYHHPYSPEAIAASKPTQAMVDRWTGTKGAWVVDRAANCRKKGERWVFRGKRDGVDYGVGEVASQDDDLTVGCCEYEYRWVLAPVVKKHERFKVDDIVHCRKEYRSMLYEFLVTAASDTHCVIAGEILSQDEAHRRFEK